MLRNHPANRFFDTAEIALRFLDPRASGRADVEANLAGVDAGEKVASHQREQGERDS